MRNDKIRKILNRYLTDDQIRVIREEIICAVDSLNRSIERDRRFREKKESIKKILEKADIFVNESSRVPDSFKEAYSTLKSKLEAFSDRKDSENKNSH